MPGSRCSELLSGIPVSWEELPEAPVARGRLWSRIAERVKSWVKGGGRLLIVVGEWGAGKSSLASLLDEEARRVGMGFSVVVAGELGEPGASWLAKLPDGIVFIDQAEDVILARGAGGFLDFLAKVIEQASGGPRVVVALTPAAYDRLRAGLAWRERLGWLTRRATVIELPRLAKDELLGVVNAVLVRMGISLDEVVERPAQPILYHASAGNPGVALKVLRDSGLNECPAGARQLLTAASRIPVPTPAGDVAAVDPRMLDLVEEASRDCGAEVFTLAAGGVVPFSEALASCLKRRGLNVDVGTLYTIANDRLADLAASLEGECARAHCNLDDVLEQLYPLEDGWGALAAGPWAGVIEEAAARVGERAGPWMAFAREVTSKLYPRRSTPPISFAPDPSTAAALDAAARSMLAEGRAASYIAVGVKAALEAVGRALGERVIVEWRGGRYKPPLYIFFEPEQKGMPCKPGVIIAVAPEGVEAPTPNCPWLRRVELPYRALRLLVAAGYAIDSHLAGVDWEAMRQVLAVIAREHGLDEAVVDSFEALEREGLVAPPAPPVKPVTGSSAKDAGYAAGLMHLIVEVAGLDGVKALEDAASLLAVDELEERCGKRWELLAWTRVLGLARPAEAAVLAEDSVDWERITVMASRGLRASDLIRAEGREGREAVEFIEGALEALRAPPAPLRASPRAVIAKAEAVAARLASEAGVSRELAALAVHTVFPRDGRAVIVKLTEAARRVGELRGRAPPGSLQGPPARAWAWAVSTLEDVLEWHARMALEALNALSRPPRWKAGPPPSRIVELARAARLPQDTIDRLLVIVEEAATRLDPERLRREALARAFNALPGLLDGGTPRTGRRAGCKPEELNLLATVFREELSRLAKLHSQARLMLSRLVEALERSARAAGELEALGLGANVESRIARITGSRGPIARLEDAVELAEYIAAMLESMLPGARILAKLKREVEEKASEVRAQALDAMKEASRAREESAKAKREAETAARAGPHLEVPAQALARAAEAVESAADALETAVQSALQAAGDSLEAISDAGIGLAERLALRLGEALKGVERARSRLAEERGRLHEARRRLAEAIAEEAAGVEEAAVRVSRAASRIGAVEAAKAAARAEVAALAAKDEAVDHSIERAAILLRQALGLLAEARARLADALGDVEARIYHVVEATGGAPLDDVASAAGVDDETALAALARLSKLGLVRILATPL